MTAFKPDDLVWYATWDGKRRRAVITGSGEHKGRLVYDLRCLDDGACHWAYENQLTPRPDWIL